MLRKSVPQKVIMKRHYSLVCAKHPRQLCKRGPMLRKGHIKDMLTIVDPSKDLMHLHSVCALYLVTLRLRSCHCVIF